MEDKVNAQPNVLGEIPKNSLAWDMLQDYKLQNKRIFVALMSAIIAVVLIVAGFLLYLNQYDFSTTTEAQGVYVVVDSAGTVISSDIPPEQVKEILELINNGASQDNQIKDQEKR